MRTEVTHSDITRAYLRVSANFRGSSLSKSRRAGCSIALFSDEKVFNSPKQQNYFSSVKQAATLSYKQKSARRLTPLLLFYARRRERIHWVMLLPSSLPSLREGRTK
jgi:hypothetical protein